MSLALLRDLAVPTSLPVVVAMLNVRGRASVATLRPETFSKGAQLAVMDCDCLYELVGEGPN